MFSTKTFSRIVLFGFVALMMVLMPDLPSHAGSDPSERLRDLKAEAKLEVGEQARWRERRADHLSRQKTTAASIARSSEEYARARRLRRKRGGSSEPAAEAVQEAIERVAAAAVALEALIEEARREGIPPGWLRADP